MEDVADIQEIIIDYFLNLFKASIVTQEQNAQLGLPISIQKVKDILFSIYLEK